MKAGVISREMRVVSLDRLSLCVLILAVLTTFISGCSQETKHKVLTFFFTGVPPPEEEKKSEVEKDKAPEAAQVEKEVVPQVTIYSHPLTAAGLCSQCHESTADFTRFGGRGRRVIFRKGSGPSPGKLVVDSKKLCVMCHKDKSASEALTAGLWMHPTSANGDCKACHDPHQSTNPYVLIEKPENICTQCHKEDEMMAKVIDKEAHRQPSDCLSCHNPHLGKDRVLLTKDYKEVRHPVGPIPGLPSSQALPRELPAGSSVSEEKKD
jgi:predicted CXXCH cytochrome family protein